MNAPPPTIRTYRGKLYMLVRTEPYVRQRHGGTTELSVWLSHCADYGELFEHRTTALGKTFQPNRRCQKHKSPGKRVRNRETCEKETRK